MKRNISENQEENEANYFKKKTTEELEKELKVYQAMDSGMLADSIIKELTKRGVIKTKHMSSGIIDLSKLYELLNGIDNPYKILRAKTPEGVKYRDIVSSLMSGVSEKSGFYLWGHFNKKHFWTNIYLGKATLGKVSSLKYRIRDELGEERAFLLQDKMTDELDKECRSIYPDKWDSYKKLYERALLKHKSNCIVWTEFESTNNVIIKEIENDLIESINPQSNIHRTTPPTNLRNETGKIVNEFRHQIHEHRDLLRKNKMK